jgi:hypothetical protein
MRARGRLATTPRTPAAPEEAARGRRSAGCWRVFQRSSAYAVERARSVHIFRRPRPSPLDDTPLLGAHRGASRFRSRSLAAGSARIFRTEPQACSAAFAASRRAFRPTAALASRSRDTHAGRLRADLAISRSSPCFDRVDRSASLDAHAPPALPCSRSRMFSIASPKPPRVTSRWLRSCAFVHTRVRSDRSIRRSKDPTNTLTARVHIQRIVIEKVWPVPLGPNHPARAFETSDQTFAATELLLYSRELSSTRLAALPFGYSVGF